MKKFFSLLLSVIMAVSLLSGCQKGGGSASSKSAAVAAGASNGKITTRPINVCVGSEPKSLDPAINQTVPGSIVLHHVFEGLMKYDKNLKVVPGIAESYKVSKDNITYTFNIRKDAKWSDGKAVVAGDFVYSWQRAVNPSTAAAYAYQLYYIKNAEAINSQYVGKDGKPAKVKIGSDGKPEKDAKGNMIPDANGKYVCEKSDGTPVWLDDMGVKAKDDHTLVVTLENPCAYITQIFAFPTLFPVRKDIVEANPDKWAADPSTYICDGPYTIKSWTHSSKIVLQKSQNYYAKDEIIPEQLNFLLMDDTDSILAAFKNGELDLSEDYPTAELANLKAQGQAQIYDSLAIYYYAFNDKIKPFNDIKVREALTLAVDRDYLVKNITKGDQEPAGMIVPPGIKDADGNDFRKNGGDVFDTTAYKGNIEKAKKLLAEAGYPNGKGFPTITIKYNTEEAHQKIAEYIQSEWKKNLGINVEISNEEFSVFVADRNNGNFQVARDGWNGDYTDPMTFLDLFTTGNGNNDSKYSNKDYDKLIADAKKSVDQKVRMKDMHDAEKILMNDYGCMPIYYYTNPDLVSSKLKGYVSSPMGDKFLMWAHIEG